MALLAGCAARPGYFEEQQRTEPLGATQYLDEQTGATVTITDRPIVFARERSERAANLRDYVNLSAASVNRGGKREFVLVAYVWSTLDRRFAPVDEAASLVVRADDRQLTFTANGMTPQQLGIGRPVHPPQGQQLVPLVFPTDLATIRYLATAQVLGCQVGLQENEAGYELWDDQRAAFARFVAQVEGQPLPQTGRR